MVASREGHVIDIHHAYNGVNSCPVLIGLTPVCYYEKISDRFMFDNICLIHMLILSVSEFLINALSFSTVMYGLLLDCRGGCRNCDRDKRIKMYERMKMHTSVPVVFLASHHREAVSVKKSVE